jgi:hypothetical protein
VQRWGRPVAGWHASATRYRKRNNLGLFKETAVTYELGAVCVGSILLAFATRNLIWPEWGLAILAVAIFASAAARRL